MSAGLRRARRRPPLAARAATWGVALLADPGGRPGPRRDAAPPDSARSSCREAPLMASRTAPAKVVARESRVERSDVLGMLGATIGQKSPPLLANSLALLLPSLAHSARSPLSPRRIRPRCTAL